MDLDHSKILWLHRCWTVSATNKYVFVDILQLEMSGIFVASAVRPHRISRTQKITWRCGNRYKICQWWYKNKTLLVCAEAKQCRVPFKNSESKSENILDLVILILLTQWKPNRLVNPDIWWIPLMTFRKRSFPTVFGI
jgi:hypothetical protein